MNGNQGFNDENRYEMRKRKRMNRILNISILLVGALIVFFAVQLFLPGSEEAAEDDTSEPQQNEETEPSEEETTEEQTTEEQTVPEDNPETDNQNETPDTNNQDDSSPVEKPTDNSTDSEENNSTTEEENDSDSEPDNEENDGGGDSVSIPEGGGPDEDEWEPIGTEQSGSFSHNFDTDSQNWAEMEAALRYAAGLDEEEAETWRIENGGAPNRAIGYVSTYENRQTPYKVTMEFVEDEGWKPVEVEQADSNPEL
ncbi:YrrS family protein [Salibacterium sp. K-3]